MVVVAGARAHGVLVRHTGAVRVGGSLVPGVADGIGAGHGVCGVAGTVVSVLTNAISMAGVVGVLLVGVAVAVAVAAVAAVAVARVAVVVVRGGSGRLILTNDTAGLSKEASGGSIGKSLGA